MSIHYFRNPLPQGKRTPVTQQYPLPTVGRAVNTLKSSNNLENQVRHSCYLEVYGGRSSDLPLQLNTFLCNQFLELLSLCFTLTKDCLQEVASSDCLGRSEMITEFMRRNIPVNNALGGRGTAASGSYASIFSWMCEVLQNKSDIQLETSQKFNQRINASGSMSGFIRHICMAPYIHTRTQS